MGGVALNVTSVCQVSARAPLSLSSTTISGNSSETLGMKGWISTSPKRRENATCSAWLRCCSGKEHEVFEPGGAQGPPLIFLQRAEMNPADFGAECAPDRTHLQLIGFFGHRGSRREGPP